MTLIPSVRIGGRDVASASRLISAPFRITIYAPERRLATLISTADDLLNFEQTKIFSRVFPRADVREDVSRQLLVSRPKYWVK